MMRKLYIKLLIATLPVIAVLCLYFFNDPFQVLYHHDTFFPRDGVQHVSPNKDYTSTEMFLNNYDKFHYDSYIFGNSCSMYYHVDEWKKYIGAARCFHYDAYGECLYGVERKFQFLYDRGVKMKNALLIMDMSLCDITEDPEFEARKHPLITGQSWLSFQYRCLIDFFDPTFLTQYVKYLATGKVTPKRFDNTMSNIPTHFEAVANELTFPEFEEAIARNRDSFYNARKNIFYQRRETTQKLTLGPKQQALLKNIKRILDANHTSYRLVLSPMYDQKKTHPQDLRTLQNIFGKEYVFDFSGKNDLTESIYSYYEDSHYRPFVADKVLRRTYGAEGVPH